MHTGFWFGAGMLVGGVIAYFAFRRALRKEIERRFWLTWQSKRKENGNGEKDRASN